MRALLDANVLYPTVMRECVIGCAIAGLFEPRWSARILEEWARAAGTNLGMEGETIARGEIVQLRTTLARSEVPANADLEARLWLPDRNDIHVLAAAITGHCDIIVTMNAKDFPRPILADEGLRRIDPDTFLTDLGQTAPAIVSQVAQDILERANFLSDTKWTARSLMKKTRLPKFGKWLEAELDA